ncbi:MAG TPA: type II secretion system F family protein [Gammaproteobacteria bacterium]|nr:type II secretion system F family protein [Gammaproteobacteria bacterium]
MPNYRYRARNRLGEIIEGRVEAANTGAVAAQLINGDVTPIEIIEAAKQTSFLDWQLVKEQPTLTDLILFARQLYALLRAGVPINQAMTGLVRSTRNPGLVEVLRDVQTHIESGRELSACLALHPKVFSTLFVSIIRIGEKTGRLDDSLLQLAQYLDLEKDTRERVKAALRYPAMVIVAIGVAIGILNVLVIPKFAELFARANVELPLPTRILIGTSNIFVHYWPAMIIVILAAAVMARSWVATEQGRLVWDRMKLRLPVVGDILTRAALGRFARALSMALKAGVPLIQSLNVVARAVDNTYIGSHILSMRTGVERGDTLSHTATLTGIFSPLVIQMLMVGEDTGAIDQLMEEVAGFYEREVDYDIKNLSQTIEPILIVCLGCMVLILALGIFLPMWDLAAVKLRH